MQNTQVSIKTAFTQSLSQSPELDAGVGRCSGLTLHAEAASLCYSLPCLCVPSVNVARHLVTCDQADDGKMLQMSVFVCLHDGARCQLVESESVLQGCMQAAEDVVSAVRQGGCPAVAVVGSKGVGKSTLGRLLVNSLLEASPAVAYLDTDCGQSEFTVPGQYHHMLERSGAKTGQPASPAETELSMHCYWIISIDFDIQDHECITTLFC